MDSIRIVQIETAISEGSVALSENGKTLESLSLPSSDSHSAMLGSSVQELLNSGDGKSIDAVAVSMGPGSYTGLRIGMSFARGLAIARKVPLIGLETLAILANCAVEAGYQNRPIRPLLDARRMEVYTALFGEGLKRLEDDRAQVVDESTFREDPSNCLYFGNGVEKLMELYPERRENFHPEIRLHASGMSALAFEQFKVQDITGYQQKSIYLKEFKVGDSGAKIRRLLLGD